MKRIYYPLFMLAICCLAILSTSCEDETDNGGSQELTTEQWITDFLHTEYLWNDEAKAKTPDNSSPENLFYSLLSLKDGKTRPDGTHYYYSYIEKNTSTRTIDSESSYGFEFALYNVVGDPHQENYYYARILYVLPGSPAEKAGLRRGNWIFYINGARITSDNYKQLMNGGEIKLRVSKSTTSPGKDMTVSPSVATEENPLFLDTVLNVNNTRVGYLVYNHFKTGIGDNANDYTYDNEMTGIFKNFKNEGVTEFVLDLRYNGGGYLSCAQLLGGFLVPYENRKSIFCYLEDNKGEKKGYQFIDKGYNLGLSRIFILASSQTASASEAVINGLKPYMDVILIGETTEGKNVGSIHEEHGEWAIQPIVSRIYNRDKVSGYENGFTPEAAFQCNELNTGENGSLHELGDRQEYMLAKALSVIEGKSPSAVPATRGNDASHKEPIYNSVERKQSNAVIIR